MNHLDVISEAHKLRDYAKKLKEKNAKLEIENAVLKERCSFYKEMLNRKDGEQND